MCSILVNIHFLKYLLHYGHCTGGRNVVLPSQSSHTTGENKRVEEFCHNSVTTEIESTTGVWASEKLLQNDPDYCGYIQ